MLLKWLYIGVGSLFILSGLITFWLPLPIGMPLILIGAPIVMRHSLKGRRLILKTVRRFPVLERGLNRTRRNGPP